MTYMIIFLQGLLSAAVASWSVSYNPTGICVLEGSSVDFSCSFDYPDYLRVTLTKWFRPDKNQKQDGSQQGITVYHSNRALISWLYKDRTAYANQNKNCSLQLQNVSKGDIGRYFFRIETNYYFEKFTGSGGIHLKVAVLPLRVTVKTQKAREQIDEGDSVTLTCSAENCTPTEEPFIWFKNHLLLPQATESELRISSVSHSDAGNYSCGLKNSNTTSSAQTLLDIRYRPKDVEISVSSSEEIREGNPLTLICKSKANPAVTNYSWFRIRDADVSSVGSGSELTFRSTSLQDAGLYFCTATNPIGTQKSTVIALKVKVASDHFLLSASAVFLFVMALLLVLFVLFVRKKQHTSQKQTAEQTPAVTDVIYENLRKSSETNSSAVIYADLKLPPSNSDRPRCDSQECDSVIYSLIITTTE
ncbi:B-cell receptor CD22 [Danio aesculapii]|uniref:B-cell receptor CD22 n=1 Tax=Danio aesculapii TaxID=1142201 RepID=UPI0024C0AEE3|nr:B-cell receptor CD22 [Danio aesculapii]